jgi:hypothetical protein
VCIFCLFALLLFVCIAFHAVFIIMCSVI